MPQIIHGAIGILLVLAHGLFLFRGLAMRRNGGSPGTLDKVARFISHFGLPAVLLTGFLTEKASEGAIQAIHIVLGILPIVAIIAFTPFLSFRRRIPWILPAINLVLLTAAALTGIY